MSKYEEGLNDGVSLACKSFLAKIETVKLPQRCSLNQQKLIHMKIVREMLDRYSPPAPLAKKGTSK